MGDYYVTDDDRAIESKEWHRNTTWLKLLPVGAVGAIVSVNLTIFVSLWFFVLAISFVLFMAYCSDKSNEPVQVEWKRIPEIPYSTALHKDGSVNYDAFDSRTVLDWASDQGGLFGMQAEAILVFEDNGVTMPTRNRFIKSAIDRAVKEDDPDYFILDELLVNIDIGELLNRSYELSDSNVVSARVMI